MDSNGDCKRSLPKLREIFTRQRQDSDASMADCPDIEFNYDDADLQENEMAELYSYTEGPEFQLNLKAWEEVCAELGVVPLWQSASDASRRSLIVRLSDHLELCHRSPRMRAARAILYIAQGCWGEVQSDREQAMWARRNVFLLVQCGVWASFLQLLHLEIENVGGTESQRKQAVSASLADSADLRVILSVLYTVVETLRVLGDDDNEVQTQIRLAFCEELAQPQAEAEELVAMTLLGMVTRFCNSSAPHFPIRKVLLLLWKVLLCSLGGTQVLAQLKNTYRENHNLPPCGEDTLTIARTMRASSPPASAADLIEQQNNQKRRPFRRQGLMKQSSLDDSVGELDLTAAADEDEQPPSDMDEPPDLPQPPSPRPGTPINNNSTNKGLPWTPKVRQKDIDSFLDTTRVKFVGFQLQGDRTSLAGLPQPIHEGVKVLSKHVYVSLSEVQIRQEEEITRNPMSRPETDIPQTPAEILYQAMLPTLPQCMIALLKILLAAAPTSKAKTDSINIMADVLPEEMPMTVVQSMKLGVDVNRHKEVLVKAVSATLLLLLKHFRINHTYQFEFMSQHLVFANCIPLILKFFNQNIMAYVQAKNTGVLNPESGTPLQQLIALLDFPACVIGDPPEMTAEALEAGTGSPRGGSLSPGGSGGSPSGGEGNMQIVSGTCCWRNMFSCINLLRILNKLCKWKHSRIMMLVVFKSAPILKRTLKVKHAMMQLYVLKLLKMQTKYLGRQWRKTNMKTMSAIYQKVRHRLNDDWAYGNDPDARPWDFQAEECALRACVDRFNSRRYNNTIQDPDFEPLDNCVTSVLGRPVELTEEFKRHYEVWLQQEVFSASIDWDQLLAPNN
ncbi:striatin-interacting protein 1 homolog isoform X5 [Penaeus japonicus]|uniref:striatin-interacting protein 1 homolog isoform X5 n=1 Tax=Penaeus japonicus TaxID=27405 RepID=UPI001C710421|nr:striatin-interacting protein 1 homolog isoform X5 [Penaeus japonicus]